MGRLMKGCLLLLFLACFSVGGSAGALEKNMGGWEQDSPYNKMYDPAERDRIKGVVVKVKETPPLPGMSPATVLMVRESPDEVTLVHLCPSWYIGKKDTGIKKGDKVKIKGCWVEIDNTDVFMAAKVKKGDYFELKVRLTSDGTPFWTMSPEQLEKERSGS